jgi:hypothetical protein
MLSPLFKLGSVIYGWDLAEYMPPKGRVVRCELDEYFIGVLEKAESHGYKTISEAIRAGLRFLDKDISREAGDTLSPRAGGTPLSEQLEDLACLRRNTCKPEA